MQNAEITFTFHFPDKFLIIKSVKIVDLSNLSPIIDHRSIIDITLFTHCLQNLLSTYHSSIYY